MKNLTCLTTGKIVLLRGSVSKVSPTCRNQLPPCCTVYMYVNIVLGTKEKGLGKLNNDFLLGTTVEPLLSNHPRGTGR